MSKKSRRRNKKILAALALAGGAAMMAKRKKASIADMDDAGIGVTHPALSAKDWITKKASNVADSVAPISKNIFRTRHRITDSAGNTIPSTNKMANIAAMNAPKGIYPPGSVPMPKRKRYTLPSDINQFDYTSRAKGGRIGAKKGGRVTGIAKRGFGRALMKGKK